MKYLSGPTLPTLWNPVKELKVFNDLMHIMVTPAKWNPVKELKVVRDELSKILDPEWNPVKELKVNLLHEAPVNDILVCGIR